MIIETLPPKAFRDPRTLAIWQAALASPIGKLTLPIWAYDGRPLQWNADMTAVMFDCTHQEYLSDKDACSSTSLKAIARSPRHLLQSRLTAGVETLSRRLGTAVHALVLEPARFAAQYTTWSGRRGTKAWKEFARANAGRHILKEEEMRLVKAVAERTRATEGIVHGDKVLTIGDLVDLGRPEQTIYWLDAESGVTCKARFDLIAGFLTLDLKTTDDARLDSFESQGSKLGYEIQAAFYLRGRKAFEPGLACYPFLFIAAELLEYGDVLVHQAEPEDHVAHGDSEVRRCLALYAECQRTGKYPGYSTRGGLMRLPYHKLYPRVSLH